MERNFSQDKHLPYGWTKIILNISPQLEQTRAIFPGKNLKTREPPYIWPMLFYQFSISLFGFVKIYTLEDFDKSIWYRRYRSYKRDTSRLSGSCLIHNVSHWCSCKTDCEFVYFFNFFNITHFSIFVFSMLSFGIFPISTIRVGFGMKLVSSKTWRWLLVTCGSARRSSSKTANKK